MLKDIYFKKTKKCEKYRAMLATKPLIPLPLLKIPAKEFDAHWILEHSLEEPVLLVGSNEDMGITLLDKSTSLTAIANIVGCDTPVNIIEVGTQNEIKGHTFGEYAHYLENRTSDHKILNLISLEISNTPLTAHTHTHTHVGDVAAN